MFSHKEQYNVEEISSNRSSMAKTAGKESFQNKANYRRALGEVYFDYCANSSIHGLQYIGSKRPLKDRIFWLLVFIGSIYCCALLIRSIYDKWEETPVIVSFSERSTPIWSIPFPAITICSETKRSLKTTGMSYGQMYQHLVEHMKMSHTKYERPQNTTDRDLEEFRTLLQVCNTQIIDEGMPIISNSTIDYYQVLERMLPEFERYFFYCKWFSYFGECDELFTRILTEDGICFTFNSLKATDIYREDTFQYNQVRRQVINSKFNMISNRSLQWSLQKGYESNSGIRTYPARVLGAGARAGLFIALQSFKKEIDYACRGPVQGFKVLLHAPDDVPQISKQYVRIPMGKEVLIAVKPNMITTSEGISNYDPLKRQCYLHDERKLRYFKIYTQSNCEMECLVNFTLNKCGCVKFSMPRTMDTPVCNEEKIECFDRAENELLMHEFSAGLEKNVRKNMADRPMECNCMPACTSLMYNTEISQGNFDLEEMLTAQGDTEFLNDYPGSLMSRLSIYFKENEFLTSKRSELFGIVDFLANCGGIFGLLIGFSFLSVLEVIYYFTLHFWNVLSRNY